MPKVMEKVVVVRRARIEMKKITTASGPWIVAVLLHVVDTTWRVALWMLKVSSGRFLASKGVAQFESMQL